MLPVTEVSLYCRHYLTIGPLPTVVIETRKVLQRREWKDTLSLGEHILRNVFFSIFAYVIGLDYILQRKRPGVKMNTDVIPVPKLIMRGVMVTLHPTPWRWGHYLSPRDNFTLPCKPIAAEIFTLDITLWSNIFFVCVMHLQYVYRKVFETKFVDRRNYIIYYIFVHWAIVEKCDIMLKLGFTFRLGFYYSVK